MTKLSLAFLFCFSFVQNVVTICNITTLSSVDVILRTNSEQNGQKAFNVNFNLMDGYPYIDVIKANVSVLCEGIVKNFPQLESLSLINAHVKQVERGAFQGVPRLKDIVLSVNQITEVRNGEFNYIKTLEVLYLSSNEIRYIEDAAFEGMSNLKRLYLDRNQIDSFNANWFRDCNNLILVDLTHNKIASISNNAFATLKIPEHTELPLLEYRLGYNRIQKISPSAIQEEQQYLILRLEGNNLSLSQLPDNVFKNLIQVNSLVLNTNQLTCISEETLSELKYSFVSLHLVNNPIECQCLKHLNVYVEKDSLPGKLYINSSLNCDPPKQPEFPDWFHLEK